jgi:hypothetical protein
MRESNYLFGIIVKFSSRHDLKPRRGGADEILSLNVTMHQGS